MKTLFLFALVTLFAAMPAWAGANRPQAAAPSAPVAAAPLPAQALPSPKAHPLKGLRQHGQKHSPLQKLRTQLEGKLRITIMCAIAALIFSVAAGLLSLTALGVISSVLWLIALIFFLLWIFENL